MILILDHFDSFTWNLYQYIGELGFDPEVRRTDVPFSEIQKLKPTHLVLSPGEGHPKDVLLFHQALDFWKGKIPILGVCLGHQAIAHYFGAEVKRSALGVMHGKTSKIVHSGQDIFAGLPNPFMAMRYHSLVATWWSCHMSGNIEVIAVSENDEIMAIKSRDYPNIFGVQFHPESYFTSSMREVAEEKRGKFVLEAHYGKILLQNFLLKSRV